MTSIMDKQTVSSIPKINQQLTLRKRISNFLDQQLKFKRLIYKAKVMQAIQDINYEDKLHIKQIIIVPMVVLFNLAIASAALIYKSKKSLGKSLAIPAGLFGIGAILFKMHFEWQNKEFLRMVEANKSQVGYWFRKEILQNFSEYEYVKPRAFLYRKYNQEYENIYFIK